MMTPKVLLSEASRARIESELVAFLNSQQGYLSVSSVNSPRAVGDAIQGLVAQNLSPILGDGIYNYTSAFERRAMADLAFEDADGSYYVVDVKTHRLSTKFNMPNLTSVERLAAFYERDDTYYVLLMVKYDVRDTGLLVDRVYFVPIEHLDWSCLTIGALGWGQIQIANANHIVVNSGQSRKAWMLQLCDRLLTFYPREIAKITKRISHFEQMRLRWAARGDS